MTADITDTDVLGEDRTAGRREFRFVKGPLFGKIILADEINRTPRKTQNTLLEAMQERQLTIGGRTYPLPDPFIVLATQTRTNRRELIRCRKRSSIDSSSDLS